MLYYNVKIWLLSFSHVFNFFLLMKDLAAVPMRGLMYTAHHLYFIQKFTRPCWLSVSRWADLWSGIVLATCHVLWKVLRIVGDQGKKEFQVWKTGHLNRIYSQNKATL